MRKIKLSLSLFVIVFVSAFNLKAQTDSTFYSNQLQFHFVNGYSFSYLKFLDNSSALRYKADVQLNYQTNDNDVTNRNYQAGSQNYELKNSEEGNSNGQYFSVSVQYLFTWKAINHLEFFVGAGPILSFERSYYENVSTNNNITSNSKNEYSDLATSWGLGVLGSAGLQCKVYQNINLIAEYNLKLGYGWNKDIYSNGYTSDSGSKSKNENIREGTSWNFNLSSIKLGIVFRF